MSHDLPTTSSMELATFRSTIFQQHIHGKKQTVQRNDCTH